MRLIQLLSCFLLFSTSAVADIYADCQTAIEARDKEKAEELSNLMLESKLIALSHRADGAKCVSFAKGKEYYYDINLKAFVDLTQPGAAQRAIAAKLGEEKRDLAKLRIKKAAADKINADNEAVATAKLKAEQEIMAAQRAAAMEANEAAKIQSVWARVMEVCSELYADDPTEALTRKVCLDLFLVTGLPAE